MDRDDWVLIALLAIVLTFEFADRWLAAAYN